MKKVSKSKGAKKAVKKEKKSDSDELRKPSKLKPMNTKEKKNWKKSINEEDEDFEMMPEEGDLKLDDFSNNSFDEDDDEDDGYYDDNY